MLSGLSGCDVTVECAVVDEWSVAVEDFVPFPGSTVVVALVGGVGLPKPLIRALASLP